MTDHDALLERLARHRSAGVGLIAAENIHEFVGTASPRIWAAEGSEILLRAISFRLDAGTSSLEISFISLYAALESVLTFFRRQEEFEILPDEEFRVLERELRKWLRVQPVLAGQPAKRALIYEKVRELNRFPFSSVFRKFCEYYSLDLADLWPLIGPHEEWPLLEIRHRLVHGDPFESRPVEALECANLHLIWTVERMLLCVLGWPIERSNVSCESLNREKAYQSWPTERARFG
jgi:hypothetical protein